MKVRHTVYGEIEMEEVTQIRYTFRYFVRDDGTPLVLHASTFDDMADRVDFLIAEGVVKSVLTPDNGDTLRP